METTNTARTQATGLPRLTLVRADRRPLNRDDALRRVRDARRLVQPRQERFAHLKRMYD